MTLQEALNTHKEVRRPSRYAGVQLYKAGTGPHKDLVDCSYFVIREFDETEAYFSTSLDLYPEDIFASDWEVW